MIKIICDRCGADSVPGVDIEQVMEKIRAVKGIGEKRLAQIETAVGTLFEGKGETTE